jgi:hypothetical protein
MKISEAELDKFITLYKREFDENINRDEAQEKGSNLIRLIELAFKSTDNI